MTSTNQIEDSSFNALIMLIKHYNYRISRITINKLLEKNPYHPSMRALSDTLDSLDIKHSVYCIDKDMLSQIETPFIAQIKIGRGEFVWVKQIEQQTLKVVLSDKTQTEMPMDYFIQIWNGTVLLVECDELEEVNEKNYFLNELKYLFEKYCTSIFISLILTLPIIYIYEGKSALFLKQKVVIDLIGLIVSIAIVYKTFYSSRFIDRFCKVGTAIDCNSILQSRFAKPFEWLSLGEWGLIYFMATLANGLMLGTSEELTYLYLYISIFATIVSFICLIYQIRIQKFCSLCLLLTICILSGFIIVLCNVNFENGVTVNRLFYVLAVLLVTFFGWLSLRSKIINSLKYRYINKKVKPFYASFDIFNLTLNKSTDFEIPDKLTTISLKPESPVQIHFDIVLSLRCDNCARVFNSVVEIIKKRNDIEVNLLLHAKSTSHEDNELVTNLISIYIEKGFESTLDALGGWYSGLYPSLKLWIHRFGVTKTEQAHQVTQIQRDWFNEMSMVIFPVIAINKKLLPDCYELEDALYHL